MRLGPHLLGLALFTASTAAHADLLPPGGDPCAGAVADGACTQPDGQPGRCVAAKCSKLDYSQGSPPRSIETDCLRCEPAPPPPVAAAPPAAAGPPPQPATPTTDTQRSCSTTASSPVGAALLIALLGLARRRRGTPCRSSR